MIRLLSIALPAAIVAAVVYYVLVLALQPLTYVGL